MPSVPINTLPAKISSCSKRNKFLFRGYMMAGSSFPNTPSILSGLYAFSGFLIPPGTATARIIVDSKSVVSNIVKLL